MDFSSAIGSRIYPVLTMTSNSSLAPHAISSDESPDARAHRQPWWYAAPCAWWQLGSVNSTPSVLLTSSSPTFPLGVPCVRAWTIATRAAGVCFASVVVLWPIFPPWSSPCSLLVCHPRKKSLDRCNFSPPTQFFTTEGERLTFFKLPNALCDFTPI